MSGRIIFEKGEGGLGRSSPGFSQYSGMVFYRNTLPSGFSTTDRIKQIFLLEQAEELGITGDFADETKATATTTITQFGVEGDQINISFDEPDGTEVILAEYPRQTGDTSTSLLAASVAAAINLNTPTHGYTASVAAAVITITARAGMGLYPNTKTLNITFVGSVLATNTAFTGGVASLIEPIHYHISEFFRGNPQGVLWLSLQAVPSGSPTFSDIVTLKNVAQNKIRQVYVYDDFSVFATARVSALQTVREQCYQEDAPLQIVYTPNLYNTTLSSLPNLSGLNCPGVSVNIAQDLGNRGFAIYKAQNKSIGSGGKQLGDISLSGVSESIGWTLKFNNDGNEELDVVGFSNGDSWLTTAKNLLQQLENYRYTFMYKDSEVVGSFWVRWHVSTSLSSDYAYGEDNRAMDEFIRDVRTALFPFYQSTITKTAQGIIDDVTIAKWTSAVNAPLTIRRQNGDLSAFKATIDPSQDTSSGQVIVAVQIVKNDIASLIRVPIKYVKSV